MLYSFKLFISPPLCAQKIFTYNQYDGFNDLDLYKGPWKHIYTNQIVVILCYAGFKNMFYYKIHPMLSLVDLLTFSVLCLATYEDMKNVIRKLDGTELNGKRIRIVEVSCASLFFLAQ